MSLVAWKWGSRLQTHDTSVFADSSSLTPAPTMPSKLTFDLESLQLRCKQLQEELDRTRRNWSSDREESRLRESKLEANLSAARKANVELEVI